MMRTHKYHEHDHLLPNGRLKSFLPSSYTRSSPVEYASGSENERKQHLIPPTEISKRARYLILTGIWLAQFLSVRFHLLEHIFSLAKLIYVLLVVIES